MKNEIRQEEFEHWKEVLPTRVSDATVKKVLEVILRDLGPDSLGIEVGCGDGQYVKKIPNGIGLDFSFNLLKDISGFRKVVGDAMSLPFKSNTFDFVFINSLHHMDEEKVIPELLRILKTGKSLFLLEPNLLHPIRYFCMRNSLLFPEHSPDEKAFNPYKIKQLISSLGAEIVFLDFISVEMLPKTWRGRLQDILKMINTRWTHSWFLIRAIKIDK